MHSSPLRVYRSLCCAPLRVYITNFIVRAGWSGWQPREDLPCGDRLGRLKSGRNLESVAARGLQSAFSIFCALPAPCSRRLPNIICLKKEHKPRRIEFDEIGKLLPVKGESSARRQYFFCFLILPALPIMARGKLLRSRSLKRPPLANVPERLWSSQQKNMAREQEAGDSLVLDFDDWEATEHGKIVQYF